MSAFWTELPRDVLRVSGADALTYLQSQISQDIRNLGVGDTTYTFVLQPGGKVEALARIHRPATEEFLIDTDAGYGTALAARLNRFKIRVKVDIEPLEWSMIAVRGLDGGTVTGGIVDGVPAWSRDDAFDLLGASPVAPAGIRHGTDDDLRAARIEAGWPAMGAEITDASIPAETGVVPFAVNFTKGCYPGQELVERMDSRGSNAPRFVRRLRGAGVDGVHPGTEVHHDGKLVGHLTSVAVTHTGWVALAVLGRTVQPGHVVTIAAEAGAIDATVEDTTPVDRAPAQPVAPMVSRIGFGR
ncbi:MAG: hypothetical protein JWM34_2113 [Ilumatobacteraceae bacterium]|nr:hypothetical protein [Ilumatobacteraceae bacterium]